MKKLLALFLLPISLQACAADTIELRPSMDDQYCRFMKPCAIKAKYDVSITNNSDTTHHYKLTYRMWLSLYNYDREIEEVNIEPHKTYTHHKEMISQRVFDRYMRNTVEYDIFATGPDKKSVNAIGTVWMAN